MISKTVRFYDTKKTDREALAALADFKKYGYRNENHMIIEALLALKKSDEEDLAERIAEKVAKRLGNCPVEVKEEIEQPDDSFFKACAFMDGL